MQLGARWRAGDAPHRSVPSELHPEIRRAETAHPAAESWTLTWLEGRPRCALDDAVLVILDAQGAVRVTEFADSALDGGYFARDTGMHQDEDADDDWLN